MRLIDLQFWLLIAVLSGVGYVTYLLNRSGRQWGWYLLAGLIFLIIGTFVVWSAFDFASTRRGGLTPKSILKHVIADQGGFRPIADIESYSCSKAQIAPLFRAEGG
jgi:hypothetical protein